MASMAFFWGGLRCLQIGLQTREGFLGAGNIPRLEGADQTLVVCIGLAVVAKRLARRCWRIALQALHALLERGQGALGGGHIARLQSAADGIEIIDGLGQPGSFQLDCFVYGRAGQPCRLCATRIRVVRLGGRASFYCPHCQH